MDLVRALWGRLASALGAAGPAPAAVLRELARSRMEAAIPRIVRGMRRKGMTLESAGKTAVVRDALFRLWRAVIPSGDLADFVRDAQDDAVLARVEPQVADGMPLPEVVALTLAAALEAL